MSIKGKNQLKLIGKVNFCYSCKLITAQNMKNITSFGSQLSTAVLNLSTSTITHSAKYRLIIVIEKNPENIDISFLVIIAHPYSTYWHNDLTCRKIPATNAQIQCCWTKYHFSKWHYHWWVFLIILQLSCKQLLTILFETIFISQTAWPFKMNHWRQRVWTRKRVNHCT